MLVLAGPFSKLFSPVKEVQDYMALYLRLAGIGYGMQGLFLNSSTILNVLKKPLYAAGLSLAQMFFLYIPLAFLGARLLDVPGIFIAQAFSYLVIGLLANRILRRLLLKMD
jgi:Na+-driven multidrug efflux pump